MEINPRPAAGHRSEGKMAWQRFWRNRSARWALIVLLVIVLCCLATLPITLSLEYYARQDLTMNRQPPQLWQGQPMTPAEQQSGLDGQLGWFARNFTPFGYDLLGRSLFWRCLFGGVVSLGIGLAAALISVTIGTLWGALAGWYGGRVDNTMMRIVDVLYGLPYVLLIILLKIAFESRLVHLFDFWWGPGHEQAANIVILFVAIGSLSWLTMARVIRGQVLSLKAQPFIESCRALGLPVWRIILLHLMPNLVGPVIVYATLTVPQAILQESFLSFLGIGVKAPIPSWGSLASDAVRAVNTVESFWWMVIFPCALLGLTLLCLNFVGDGLRDAFDPKMTRR